MNVLLLLLGCSRHPNPSQALLPTQLSVLADQEGPLGSKPVSVVLDLRLNSRDELDVRQSAGLRLWDGRHLWEITHSFQGGKYGLHVADLHAEAGGDLPIFDDLPLEVVGMTRRDVWVKTRSGSIADCELDHPICSPAALEPLPLDHPGPGDGFNISLRDGELRLRVPFSHDEGVVILDHVTNVIGVHWVHETWMEQDPVLDRTYRGRGTIVAVPRSITLDGDLHDWGEAEPLVVEEPWQVESGGASWAGARDAGLSVAASHSGSSLCFAGRVRDDHWTDDDVLTFHVGDRSVEVDMLRVAAGTGGAANGEGARVGGGWFSRAYELCMPAPRETGDVPFAAVFHDSDPDGETVLASAPMTDGRPEGSVRIGR